MSIQLLIMLAMFGVLYAVLFIPQQRKMKAHRAMMSSLDVGDEVLLSSGIYGRIVDFDGPTMFLAVSDDLEIKVTRESVSEKVTYLDPAELQDS